MVYTPAVRKAAGGEAAIGQLIGLGIAETNHGYANSGIVGRLRLVYAAEVSDEESGDLNTDLIRLPQTDDGIPGQDSCRSRCLRSRPGKPVGKERKRCLWGGLAFGKH